MRANHTIFIILFFKIMPMTSECSSDHSAYHKFSDSCMGTTFTLLIDHDNIAEAKKGAFLAFKEAHRLNLIFSDYESESELSKLSKNSGSEKFHPVSFELMSVLSASQKLSDETNGCFDITIGPYSRLWRIARFRKSLPSKEKLSFAKNRVSYNNLVLDLKKNRAKLTQQGMVLDLGGIAKGYTADQMLKILKFNKLNRVLIDAGGDLLIGDAPVGKKGWKIEIGGRTHPDLPILTLSNLAVATSGDVEQFVTIAGKTYSHLINPITGIGLTHRMQVTILAYSAMEADALASASLVMGQEQGIKFLKSKNLPNAFFIDVIDNKTIKLNAIFPIRNN
jgi:FAD:protein FMN transferase